MMIVRCVVIGMTYKLVRLQLLTGDSCSCDLHTCCWKDVLNGAHISGFVEHVAHVVEKVFFEAASRAGDHDWK